MKKTLKNSFTLKSILVFAMVGLMCGMCDEPCKLDNSDFWRPNDHGDYNCIGDCSSGDCHLEVLVNGTWTLLNKKREDRDVVDEMAGQPIPTGPDAPTVIPTWVRCDCS